LTDWKISAEPVPADHPCLPGHFPGNPIVPGTLVLERVIDCLAQRHDNLRVYEVVNAKFLSPLQPDQAFTVRFNERAEAIDFECRRGETLLTSGRLKLIRKEGHQ
jgi:3-hydroxymyristoyl/3-hydroxydecanoyl-(acyl carrier protein) dehydratase